jgi:hypothetical protein
MIDTRLALQQHRADRCRWNILYCPLLSLSSRRHGVVLPTLLFRLPELSSLLNFYTRGHDRGHGGNYTGYPHPDAGGQSGKWRPCLCLWPLPSQAGPGLTWWGPVWARGHVWPIPRDRGNTCVTFTTAKCILHFHCANLRLGIMPKIGVYGESRAQAMNTSAHLSWVVDQMCSYTLGY